MNRSRWYKEAVVYQIYPYSFLDSDNNGLGDLAGVINKLDYIKELGATAIWFSPVYKTEYKDYGYDIVDYRHINPDLGTDEEFDELLSLCHQKGLKVIMDMVINHTSTSHKWFIEAMKDKNSPYRDYYIIQKGKRVGDKLLPPTNWQSIFLGNAWERIGDSDEFYLHFFNKFQADLNWENPKVREEMEDILKYWLDKGVDGFRFDVFNLYSKYYPFKEDPKTQGLSQTVDGPRIHEYLKQIAKVINKYDCCSVGETYKPTKEGLAQYTKEENEEMDIVFDFEHLDSDNISKFVPKPFNIKKFKDGLFNGQRNNYGTGYHTLVLENHDNPRCISRFGIDSKHYRYQAATFLATITYLGFGTPFIYMGQEIGMTNANFTNPVQCKDPTTHFALALAKKYGLGEKVAFPLIKNHLRDHGRLPMQWDDSVNAGFNKGKQPWQCINTNYKDINVQRDLASEKSIYRYYQKILKTKKENEIFINGSFKEIEHEHKKIIGYKRQLNGETVYVIGNFSKYPTKYTNLEIDFNNIIINNYDDLEIENKAIRLKPYQAIVVKQN